MTLSAVRCFPSRQSIKIRPGVKMTDDISVECLAPASPPRAWSQRPRDTLQPPATRTHETCCGQQWWEVAKERRRRQLQPSSHEDFINPFGIGGSPPLGTFGAGRTWSQERAGCPFSPPRKNSVRAQDQIACNHLLQPFSSRREGIGTLRLLRPGRGMQMRRRHLLRWQRGQYRA